MLLLISPATATTGRYKLVISEPDAKELPSSTITNIHALAVGSNSHGSGVAMLLELARLFSRLYANPNTRGHNLFFGLTSGGPCNYNGTHNLLRNFDQRLRESMELKNKAQDMDLAVELRHKKINISNSRVAWDHGQFFRQRIAAVTLLRLEEAPKLFQRSGGIADSRRTVDETVVVRNIRVISESLARHIYGQVWKQFEVFAEVPWLSAPLMCAHGLTCWDARLE